MHVEECVRQGERIYTLVDSRGCVILITRSLALVRPWMNFLDTSKIPNIVYL